jgi:hypothetical protein
MSLGAELDRIAAAAAAFAAPEERVSGVVATEPVNRGRVYLCAFETADGSQAWLALDAAGRPVRAVQVVRDAASLAALCEVAEESAGGGNLPELRARLAELRETEAPAGIEEAETAAAELAQTIEPEPRLATPEYLDQLGAAARRLERTLDDDAGSPFGAAMQAALPAVDELTAEVERRYKGPLA